MTAYVTIKNVYGCDVVYPADDTTRTFATIAGTKTLTQSTINAMKKLGYSLEIKGQTL